MAEVANIAKINVGGLDYNVKDSLAHEHFIDFNNPHQITKEQIELGNVDNVSVKDILAQVNSGFITSALGYTPSNVEETKRKIDRYDNNQDDVVAVLNFSNGFFINKASIRYDANTDTVIFS